MKIYVKNILVGVLSISLLCVCTSLRKPNKKLLADVNGYIITEDYFRKKCERLYNNPDISRVSYEEKKELLEEEIKAHLLVEAALKSGIDKTEEFKHEMHVYREQSLISLYYKKVCRELEKDLHVTKDEIEKLYNDMKKTRKRMPPLEEVMPELREEICNRKVKNAVEKMLDERFKNANIIIYENNLKELK